jgi:BirA family biotin operon repressor/biotin-[acetyl-CoA-carboxylase] ligase
MDKLNAIYIEENTRETITVVAVANSESTMADAKNGLREGAKDKTLYISDTQNTARGRFGRPYFAQPGRGIYMTMLLRPELKLTELPQYTVLTAVALVQAIEKLTNQKPSIKWVNDIFIGEKKICGILSEGIPDTETGKITGVSIGIGLNFSIADFPENLADIATSLFADGQASITRNALIAEIWSQFFALIDTDFISIYRAHLLVLGKPVSFIKQGTRISGTAIDITDTGKLIVEEPNGAKHILSSGEISLEK